MQLETAQLSAAMAGDRSSRRSRNTLIHQVQRTVARHAMLRQGQHVLAAVSGGADSIAMLWALAELAPRMNLQLSVAHLNHGIRGRAATADARFVKQVAALLHVRFVGGRRDVPQLAKTQAVSLEMAGRTARYEFLARTARRLKCDVIATAHTADDQAETVLMNLIRGTGIQGLCSIPCTTVHNGIPVVRPLREVSRMDLIRHLLSRGAIWHEDASNLDESFVRNRIRHTVLPFLQKHLNLQTREALVRLGDIAEHDNDWMESMVDQALATQHIDICGPTLACDDIAPLHLALQRRLIRRWLIGNTRTLDWINFGMIDRVIRLITDGRSGTVLELPTGHRVCRAYRHITVTCGDTQSPHSFCQPLKIPGTTALPEHRLQIITAISPGIFRQPPTEIGVYPCRASVSTEAWNRQPIFVRSWAPGDRMRPLGLHGSKKLQDIFSDAKTPVAVRRTLPIIATEQEIIWIPGYRIADGWQLLSPRQPALQMMITPF